MSLGTEFEAMVRRVVREEIAAVLPAQADQSERLLTVTKAAARADVSRTTVHRWLARGLPCRQAPSASEGRVIVRILQSDLDAWMRTLPTREAPVAVSETRVAEPVDLRAAVIERVNGRRQAGRRRGSR